MSESSASLVSYDSDRTSCSLLSVNSLTPEQLQATPGGASFTINTYSNQNQNQNEEAADINSMNNNNNNDKKRRNSNTNHNIYTNTVICIDNKGIWTTEYKNSDDKPSTATKEKEWWRKYIGLILSLFSSMMFSLNALFGKMLRDCNPFTVGIWRFQVMIIILFPLLLHSSLRKNKPVIQAIWPLNKDGHWKNIILLLVRAAIGCNAVLLIFFSLQYVSVADSTVILSITPVLVTLIAHFFLGETCGIIPLFNACLALIGVAIITRPPMLTGGETFDRETLIGSSMALGSVMLLTAGYITLRYLRNVHHSLINLTLAGWGEVQCIIIATALGVVGLPKDTLQLSLMLGSGVCGFLAQTSLTIALKHEQAGPVTLYRTSEVIFAFLWQFTFLGVYPDIFSIIGGIIVVLGVLLTTLRKILTTLPDDHPHRKRFWILFK